MTAEGRELSDTDLALMTRYAGAWGLLRDLGGRRVCMTGAMSMKRDQLARLVEAANGVFTNTISGTTDLLVTSDEGRWSAKVRAAAEKGVPVVTETEFATGLLPTPAELLAGKRARWGDERQ